MTRNFEMEILAATMRLNSLILADRGLDSKRVIAVYTAAAASNFVAWFAVTGHFVKSEVAKSTLLQNLRYDVWGNHRSVLLRSAEKCKAMPDAGDYQYIAENVNLVWALLRDQEFAGLRGLAVLATLEYLSLTFTPELARRAEECGYTDHRYPRVHSEVDMKRANALVEALEVEMGAGYYSAETMVVEAVRVAEDLVRRIFS